MMFDACFCDEPDDVSQLLRREQHKARTPHKCGECRCTIQPGDVYEIDVTVFEGHINTYKTCLPCLNIRKSLFRCGWYYGDMWGNIHEEYCDDEFCLCPRPERVQNTNGKSTGYGTALERGSVLTEERS